MKSRTNLNHARVTTWSQIEKNDEQEKKQGLEKSSRLTSRWAGSSGFGHLSLQSHMSLLSSCSGASARSDKKRSLVSSWVPSIKSRTSSLNSCFTASLSISRHSTAQAIDRRAMMNIRDFMFDWVVELTWLLAVSVIREVEVTGVSLLCWTDFIARTRSFNQSSNCPFVPRPSVLTQWGLSGIAVHPWTHEQLSGLATRS